MGGDPSSIMNQTLQNNPHEETGACWETNERGTEGEKDEGEGRTYGQRGRFTEPEKKIWAEVS